MLNNLGQMKKSAVIDKNIADFMTENILNICPAAPKGWMTALNEWVPVDRDCTGCAWN